MASLSARARRLFDKPVGDGKHLDMVEIAYVMLNFLA